MFISFLFTLPINISRNSKSFWVKKRFLTTWASLGILLLLLSFTFFLPRCRCLFINFHGCFIFPVLFLGEHSQAAEYVHFSTCLMSGQIYIYLYIYGRTARGQISVYNGFANYVILKNLDIFSIFLGLLENGYCHNTE